MVLFVRLKTLLLIFGILAETSCRSQGFWGYPDTEGSNPASKTVALDVDSFVNREHRSLKRLTKEVSETFPLQDYAYIYLGQSPTLLYAAMGYGRPDHFALPLSSVNADDAYFNFWAPGGTFYLRKLFDHFDVYLKPLIKGWASGQIPPRVVTIDFCQTGESLGHFLMLLEFYLRDTYFEDADFKRWVVERQNRFPEIHFLCLLDERIPGNSAIVDKIQKIRNFSRYYTPRPQGKLTVYRVKGGEISGDRGKPITIDTDQLFKRIEIPAQGSWSGRVVHGMFDTRYLGIWSVMLTQSSDPYSPYGSWNISMSPLERERPPVRLQFLELHQKITTHKGWGEKLLDRIGCAPKAAQ